MLQRTNKPNNKIKIMADFKFIIVFGASILFSAHCELTEEEEEMIDSFMNEIIECRGMPGAALSLVRNGEIELARGYGFANIENEEPFTEESVFNIASVTKSFTATLAAKLMATTDDMDWNTFARDILGDDFHFIDGYRSNNTMFRDLLSHQTGIPRHDTVWVLDAAQDREEIVMERVRFMPEYYSVRTDLLYNNNMYSVMGLALEQIFAGGAPWEDLVTHELFTPLGMDSSTFYDRAAPDYEGFVTPYVPYLESEGEIELEAAPYEMWLGIRLAGPAGSICSTASDMARWMQFVLSGGYNQEGDQIVQTTDLDRLWYPEGTIYSTASGKPYEPVTDSLTTNGLGYFSGHYREYRSHSHGGDLTGFHSEIFFLPDMNVSSFFNTNSGAHVGERTYVHRFMMDVLLGFEPAYNATEVCEIFEGLGYAENELETDSLKLLLKDVFSEELSSVLQEFGLASLVRDMTKSFDTLAIPMGANYGIIASKAKKKLQFQNNRASRLIENYEGVYGNFVFGNLTIVESDNCTDCLYMEYGNLGQFTLEPTNTTDSFLAFNVYPFYRVMPVSFFGEDEFGNALNVLVPFFETSAPPLFERDLNMADAPPPRNDLCAPAY